ncbi:hypothetical protein DPMN_106797 [Dreissena polymorpha]|uniref:Uncharacterized protein n=1 Tax=Dreissena polymorpha TaxID=45954 RepID=A0A9D4K5U8_DREPO|nr:hypothetical protein DPMN_106797 [Dreissena polymorpha]
MGSGDDNVENGRGGPRTAMQTRTSRVGLMKIMEVSRSKCWGNQSGIRVYGW